MSKRKPSSEYEIGRGKPPKGYSWKKGQSGNLKGRPKGKKTSPDDYLRQLRDLPVPIAGEGQPISARAAMQRIMLGKALKGDIKAFLYMETEFRRIDLEAGIKTAAPPISSSEQELIQQYLRQNGHIPTPQNDTLSPPACSDASEPTGEVEEAALKGSEYNKPDDNDD